VPGPQTAPGAVGVIGTGQLGSVIAHRLLGAGYDVVAYDRDPRALAGLEPAVRRASGPREVAEAAPTVITCVTDAAAVRECVLGDEGLLAAAGAQTLVLEMTTSSPVVTRELGAVLAGVGAAMVDAPVSRGVPAARRGELSAWLGGDAADVARARPYLEPLATDVLHVGPLGAGHTVKAVNMMLMGVNLLATAEAAVVARSYGIDPERLMDVLNASSGGSYMTSNHFPRFVLSGSYESGFTSALMRKDLKVAVELAHDLGEPVLFGARALEMYNAFLAQADVRPDTDNMRVVQFVAELMGDERTQVRA
jgi:3-hydroxyisobutyrate dehydrogenase-like beta-hydroxyacid dehydrogenase